MLDELLIEHERLSRRVEDLRALLVAIRSHGLRDEVPFVQGLLAETQGRLEAVAEQIRNEG